MKSTTAALALLALDASTVAAQRVLKADFVKRLVPNLEDKPLAKRATVAETLTNAQYLYLANITVGTPPQPITLQIDTGSSDIWMSSSTASNCTGAAGAELCSGGTFNSGASSTYKVVNNNFNISYVDGTGSVGDYITDTFKIGGATVQNQEMGLAFQTSIGTGIMGLGYPIREATCRTYPCATQYSTLVQNMVANKQINSAAYSLWLDDLQANTGSVLFGGVDTSRYIGNLVTLPIQLDADAGIVTDFTVAWTGFSIGGCSTFAPVTLSAPAILDSGTTLTVSS